MVEDFYGLKRRPFRAAPNAAEVFVGPQTAKVVHSMKKALDAPDAVVAILGPAGVGKSALVKRSLSAIGRNVSAIHVPRMQVAHDEVLEFLLDALDARDIPAGTIRKITLFRRLLAERAKGGARQVIVVEDAVRLGKDVLAELEALSAADGLDYEGANLVLMGMPAMLPLLKSDDLARLAQRIRLYQHVQPLAAAEMLGYFKHSFRLAGSDFDRIFADGSADLLHELSGGIPRIANNLVESVIAAAAERREQPIDTATIARVANEEYGLTANTPLTAGPPGTGPEPTPESASRPDTGALGRVPDPAPVPVTPAAGEKPDPVSEIPELIQDTLPDLEILAPGLAGAAAGNGATDAANDADERDDAANADSVAANADSVAANADSVDDIPTLFSSHRMESPMAGKAARSEEQSGKSLPAPATSTASPAGAQAADTKPPSPPVPPQAAAQTAVPPAAPKPAAAEEPPAWDRDPTLAELRPDIEALEEAMAGFAVPDDEDKRSTQAADETPEVELRDPTIPSLPEITLDSAIESSIAEATAALEKADRETHASSAEDGVTSDGGESAAPAAAADTKAEPPAARPAAAAAPETRATEGMEKIAAGLARARTLEDVDDLMAETLFGTEFSTIAAQVIANPPPAETNDGTVDGALEPAAEPPPKAKAQAKAQPAPAPKPAGSEPRSALEQEFIEVYGDDALNVSIETETPRAGLDLSASQRLATVRALNAGNRNPAAANGAGRPRDQNGGGAAPAARPQSIEDQIDTSITQTLKALKRRPADNDDDDDDDRKSGFFSRFRRP